MSDIERIAPGQPIWRRPNEEPPQRSPGHGPHDGDEPKDEQEPPKDDPADEGHIDVYVRPSATAISPP